MILREKYLLGPCVIGKEKDGDTHTCPVSCILILPPRDNSPPLPAVPFPPAATLKPQTCARGSDVTFLAVVFVVRKSEF